MGMWQWERWKMYILTSKMNLSFAKVQSWTDGSDFRFRIRDLETVQKRRCCNFPTLFWDGQIFGHFQHNQKSSESAISGSILHHLWSWCSRCVKKWTRVHLYLFPGDLDLERVWPRDSFSKIPTVRDKFLIYSWSIFQKYFGGIEQRKQNRVDWYIFGIFSYCFRHWPILGGIKTLILSFLGILPIGIDQGDQ